MVKKTFLTSTNEIAINCLFSLFPSPSLDLICFSSWISSALFFPASRCSVISLFNYLFTFWGGCRKDSNADLVITLGTPVGSGQLWLTQLAWDQAGWEFPPEDLDPVSWWTVIVETGLLLGLCWLTVVVCDGWGVVWNQCPVIVWMNTFKIENTSHLTQISVLHWQPLQTRFSHSPWRWLTKSAEELCWRDGRFGFMFSFRVLSRRWRRISAVILGNVISVKYLPFRREFEDLTWNTEFYRGRGKTCQCSSSPFHREEGPGRLHLGAVGPVGLPWSRADAAVSKSQCLLAAAATFHLHWRRYFDYIWIICCLRVSIAHYLLFSKPRHCMIWPKPGGNHITGMPLLCAAKPLAVKCL